jgi:hypothetical protein
MESGKTRGIKEKNLSAVILTDMTILGNANDIS